jgi:hypothetical protein
MFGDVVRETIGLLMSMRHVPEETLVESFFVFPFPRR